MVDKRKNGGNPVASIQFIASAGTGKTHQVTSLKKSGSHPKC